VSSLPSHDPTTENHWPERELEDFIAAYPEALFGQGAILYGRQVHCVAGIIDLIIGIQYELYIVELKAQQATMKDAGQVCRYAAIASGEVYVTDMDVMTAIGDPYGFHVMGDIGEMIQVIPVLVAPSFARNVGAVCLSYVTERSEAGFSFRYYRRSNEAEPELKTIMARFARTLLWSNSLCEASLLARKPKQYDLRWPKGS
jgi:hypothetical protein